MIEFNGPLTGDAHKHYLYKFSRSVSRVVRAALVFPLIFFGALIHTNNFILMMLTGVLFVILYSSFVLLFFRKFSKKANIDKIIIIIINELTISFFTSGFLPTASAILEPKTPIPIPKPAKL